jgi:hypothetical protein
MVAELKKSAGLLSYVPPGRVLAGPLATIPISLSL